MNVSFVFVEPVNAKIIPRHIEMQPINCLLDFERNLEQAQDIGREFGNRGMWITVNGIEASLKEVRRRISEYLETINNAGG